MDWGGEQRPGDRIADWTGALALGGAGAFAGFAMGPAWFPGSAAATGAVAGLAACAAGLGVMRRTGREAAMGFEFEPVAFETCTEMDELVLVNRLDAPELLLVDALGPPDPDARVLRLFAPETLAVPGELAARIETWLEGAVERSHAASERAVSPSGHGPQSSPASAALHGALADIRRSLR